MQKVIQLSIGRNTAYKLELYDNNNKLISTRLIYTEVYTRTINEHTFRMLYTPDMVLQKEFTNYLSSTIVSRKSPNTISLIIERIKVFSNFLQLRPELSCYTFKIEALQDYITFLSGNNIINGTIRSNDSINHNLATIREFFSFLDIDCKVLFATNVTERQGYNATAYTSNLPSISNEDTVPMYHTPAELQRLITEIEHSKPIYSSRLILAKEEADKEFKESQLEIFKLTQIEPEDPIPLPSYDEQASLIVHLALLRGLRLGEILGLTIEDLEERDVCGKIVKGVLLRNRLSDASFQCAKNLIHPTNIEMYNSRNYKSKDGTRFVPIPDSLFDDLKYFAITEYELYKRAYPSGVKDLIADSVYIQSPVSNHYIFIGRYGERLTDQSWNNRLKSLFLKAGLPIDKGTRQTNLTHRLRHSMAMILVEGGASILELQASLRHSSIYSCKAYFNPTDEDMRVMMHAFDTEVYDFMKDFDDMFQEGDELN